MAPGNDSFIRREPYAFICAGTRSASRREFGVVASRTCLVVATDGLSCRGFKYEGGGDYTARSWYGPQMGFSQTMWRLLREQENDLLNRHLVCMAYRCILICESSVGYSKKLLRGRIMAAIKGSGGRNDSGDEIHSRRWTSAMWTRNIPQKLVGVFPLILINRSKGPRKIRSDLNTDGERVTKTIQSPIVGIDSAILKEA